MNKQEIISALQYIDACGIEEVNFHRALFGVLLSLDESVKTSKEDFELYQDTIGIYWPDRSAVEDEEGLNNYDVAMGHFEVIESYLTKRLSE